MDNKFTVSASPHLRTGQDVNTVMWSVVIALFPALVYSGYHFGLQALITLLIAIGTALVTEAGIQLITKKEITIPDGSAAITGILVAFNIPPSSPWWMTMVGSFVAIAVAKYAFGGLGYNIFNPALIGRAFLLAAWPVHMTSWDIDGVTSATPLGILKEGGAGELALAFDSKLVMYKELFIGNTGGCIGETSALLLLIGAVYLLVRKIITWHIPVSFLGTLAVCSWIFGGEEGFFAGDPVFHLLAGGAVLGAFYMATDMVTSPVTSRGMLVFGFGCGLVTAVIRKFGGYPEGVSYSILLMNACTPLIDRWLRPARFGDPKKTRNTGRR